MARTLMAQMDGARFARKSFPGRDELGLSIFLVAEEREPAVPATLAWEPSTAQHRNEPFHAAQDDFLFRTPNQSCLSQDVPSLKSSAANRATDKRQLQIGLVCNGISSCHIH